MSFERQIKNWTRKADKNFQRTHHQAVQSLVNEAQATMDKGGRMRRKTGFLLHSGGAGLNEMPSGPTENPNPGGQVTARLTGMGLTEALGRWKPGDTFFWAWSASYARAREAKDGFQRGAAEKWEAIVASAARMVRR